MKWLNRLTSLFLMGFSVLIFRSSVKLGIGSPKEPGPGFMPVLASVLIFCLSSWVLMRPSGGINGDKALTKSRAFLLKSAFFVLTILAYAFLLNVVGYMIAAFFLIFAEFSITEPRKWPKNMAMAAAVSVLTFLVFRRLLGVQLPRGIFSI